MLPFITIFGFEIPMFGTIGILGLVIATFVASCRAKRYNLTRSDTVYIASYVGIGLIVGAMLMFAITRIPVLWRARELITTNILAWLNLGFGGLVFYGGLFGAVIAAFLYAKKMNQPFGNIVLLIVPVFPLAHAFMRIGCFLAGCCFGMESEFGIAAYLVSEINGVRAIIPNGIRLPVQLYESFANLIIFAVIWTFTIKERRWQDVICFYGLMYSVVRFVLEYFRGDAARGALLWFSTSQWISIAVFAVCVFGLMYKRKKI